MHQKVMFSWAWKFAFSPGKIILFKAEETKQNKTTPIMFRQVNPAELIQFFPAFWAHLEAPQQ